MESAYVIYSPSLKTCKCLKEKVAVNFEISYLRAMFNVSILYSHEKEKSLCD